MDAEANFKVNSEVNSKDNFKVDSEVNSETNPKVNPEVNSSQMSHSERNNKKGPLHHPPITIQNISDL